MSVVAEADQGFFRRHSREGDLLRAQVFIITREENPRALLGPGLYAFRLARR
ncbi:hypothetical protein D3C75_1389470 [compost metagenome]